uniref:Reverse transcriptase domain-containing protein n=1 Tax=Tanacetum cinerariifolium TaxID=118510 RepID=A0A699H166_TANCI|nr:reverse transcriptase domain-containing protein [Tanacetum cinerariifolium]
MDDEPMWAADCVVTPTLGFVITIPEITNEFAIKGNHLTLVKGNQFDEEDSKVPLILGRPFLHTVDAVIWVKQNQLNLRVRTERVILNIDSTIKHSYSHDETCFSIDVINEILEEEFDALLDEGSEIFHYIEGTILKEKLFAEFDEFMAMAADENSESESDTEEPSFKKSPLKLIIRSKHLLKNLLRIFNSNLFLITWNMHSWKNPLLFS